MSEERVAVIILILKESLAFEANALKHSSYLCSRFNYNQVQEPLHYSNRDALSGYSSPFKPSSRQPRDARSMPPTPLLTRNAYSSSQLRYGHRNCISLHFIVYPVHN